VRNELLKRSRFLADYREIVLRLSEANVIAADRFCDAVEAALELLASHPELGPKAGFLKAADVRFWPLRRYPNFLVFYRVDGGSVIMLRLLDGRRNLPLLMREG
jgi:plasmid stabilization system protein ParE